jgi:AraC-like DNA-binding protein
MKGEGTRYVGDNISPFSAGDLVLLGPDLPHVWKSHDRYHSNDCQESSSSIAVHFNKDFLGRGFFNLPEMHLINELLEKCRRGMDVRQSTKSNIALQLKQMVNQSSTERLLTLLNILNLLSRCRDPELLSTPSFLDAYVASESTRIKNVHRFVISNFRETIKLEDAASAANMTPTAFCRYFKQHTRKTFSAYLNEVRVGYACRMLQENNFKISQICYESGFCNLSNFNKQFKVVMGLTPLQYQKSQPY